MKPELSAAFFFLIISFVLLLFCFFGGDIISAFENITTVQSAAKDYYLLIGTQKEILSLQVSRGEIEKGASYRRSPEDPLKSLPKEFIFVEDDVSRRNDHGKK